MKRKIVINEKKNKSSILQAWPLKARDPKVHRYNSNVFPVSAEKTPIDALDLAPARTSEAAKSRKETLTFYADSGRTQCFLLPQSA